MKIEDYFEDISQVKLEFNGEKLDLKKYGNIKNKFKIYNNEIAKYVNVNLIYADEFAGNIEGYILDCNEYKKYLDDGIVDKFDDYTEDIYWELDSKWDDLGTFFKVLINNEYSLKKLYFIIKNIEISSEFKNEGVEKFFINEVAEIIKNNININIDYLVILNDTSKFTLSNETKNLKFGQKIKILILQIIKKINYMGKEKKEENIISIAKETDFEILYTKEKNIKLWVK